MKKDVLFRLLSYTKKYKRYIFLAVLSAIISVGLTLYAPILIGFAIDCIVEKNNVDFPIIIKYIIMLAIVIAFAALFQWIMSFCANKLTYHTIKDLRTVVFDKLTILPLKYIDSTPQGEITNNVINDIDQISDGLLQGFTQFFTGIITIIGTVCFIIAIDIKIAIVIVLVTPLSFFVASYISKHAYSMFRQQSAARGELSGFAQEMISNQKIVKAFSYEDDSQRKFEEINEKLYKCGVKAQFISAMTNPCTRFVNGVVYAAVGIAGAISAINGGLSIGQLSCILSYANQYTKPFNEITGVITELQSAFASARRVFKILDEPAEISDKDSAILKECNGNVDISHVNFSYYEETSLIKDLNLAVKKGQRVAIVGPTGCGKTTIINLLMRFYDTVSGEICVSNIPIKSITRQSLREKYGMILQETWVFSRSIGENIAYGRENATLDEIINAAKSAHADSFIRQLKNGYNTIISEDGGNISAGQKQLLCIARIMLTKPELLILDEATSSIDTRTEQKIQQAFNKIMEGRTSFVIAHRLSTIREADVILVMNAGKVIEQGSHAELISKNGFYANLYNSQFDFK